MHEPLALTSLAGQREVCHKLHLDGNISRTLTFLASSAFSIEREVLGRESHLLSQWLVGKEGTYRIVRLQISGRVAAGTLSDRVLVNKLYMTDALPVAFHRCIFAWGICYEVQTATHGRVEDSLDERTLARA